MNGESNSNSFGSSTTNGPTAAGSQNNGGPDPARHGQWGLCGGSCFWCLMGQA